MSIASSAWVHLTRLCGCNYEMPVQRAGRFVYVRDPHHADTRYRLDAAAFDAGKRAFRESWCIERWDECAAATTQRESNWMD